jgi:outer membrane protein TolC
MKKIAIFFIILLFFITNDSQALSMENAIEFAIKNNQEIKICEHKLNNSKNLNYQALAEFLPKIFINIQNGERVNNNSISNENNQKKAHFSSREISIEHNIFNGFSSIINLKKSAKQYLIELAILNDKKQSLGAEVAKYYANIFWQKQNLINYKKILDITKKILEIESRKLDARLIDKEQLLQNQIDLSNLYQKIQEEEFNLTKNQHDFFALVGVDFVDDKKMKNIEKFFNKKEILAKINQNYLLQSKYLKYNLSLDDISLKTATFLPKISLIGNISKQKNNLYFANKEIDNRSIILNFSIPIFQQGLEFIDYKSAKNQSEIAFDEYEIYKNYLVAEISKTNDEFESTLLNLKICDEAINFLEEKNLILQSKFDAKIIDLTEFYRGEIAVETQKITKNKLQNILAILHYKILELVGEIND